jgi:hypothetical protein
MHQHADDTTLHARTVEDAGVLLAEAVQPFCAASGAELSLPKSWGLTLGSHPLLVGPHAATGVPFVAPGEAVRHLGVPLVVGDAGTAIRAVFSRKLQAIRFRILRWGRFKLTYAGRVHVAKQVLASVVIIIIIILHSCYRILGRAPGPRCKQVTATTHSCVTGEDLQNPSYHLNTAHAGHP